MCIITQDQLLAPAQSLANIDIATITVQGLEEISGQFRFRLEHGGEMHGMAVWWDTSFEGHTLIMDTDPNLNTKLKPNLNTKLKPRSKAMMERRCILHLRWTLHLDVLTRTGCRQYSYCHVHAPWMSEI